MNKQLLIDRVSIASSPLIVEGKLPNGRMKLKGKLQEADVKNGNGRVYPRDVLEEKINKYIQNYVKNKTSLGELDHPDSSVINLKNVSHVITEIWWEGNNVMGSIELLETPSGKIAQSIVQSGIPLGISSRGMGSVQQIGETVEVQDDLEFICFDLVSTPSTPNAYMNLAEGLKYSEPNKYNTINEIITDIICSNTGFCECTLK